MKAGYSLLELTIGIFLASLLAVSLFQSVGSTTQTVALADQVMDLDMRTAIFHHQFQKDTIGIFVPSADAIASQDTGQAQQGPEKKEEKQKPGTPPSQKEKPEAEEKQTTLPSKLFFSTNKDNQLVELTFITTNPMQIYSQAKNSTVLPRMVRVVYRIEADSDHKNAYTLYRQEADTLELDKFKGGKIRSYELLGNIKSFKVTFSFPVKKESKDEEKKWPPEIEIERRDDWPYVTEKEAQEKKTPPHPQLIMVELEMWDNTFQDFRSFTFSYPIASFTLLEKKKPRQKKQLKKPAQKPKGPPGANLKKETQNKLAQIGEHMMAVFTKKTTVVSQRAEAKPKGRS